MFGGVFHRVFHRFGSFPHDGAHIVTLVTGVIHRVFHRQGGMGRPSGCSRPDGGGGVAPITQIVWCVSRFAVFPVLFCDVGPTLRDPLLCWGPLVFALFCCHGFVEHHCCFAPLNVFAYFCNISFVFMHFYAFVRLCAVLPLRHALAPCMVHGIGMHVMRCIIVMCSSSCSRCSS